MIRRSLSMRCRRRLLGGLLVVAAAAAAGCRVFDERLYLEAEAARADAASAADAPADGLPLVVPGERCDQPVPAVTSSGTAFLVDTTRLNNDQRAVGMCLPSGLQGPDGFLGVAMSQGERWHIHANPRTATANAALYVLASCDDRTCQSGHGVDDCGPGQSEHLSFVAPRTQTYFVGIDSRDPGGGGVFDVLVVRPTCGNKDKEHSENCDDGNTDPGDGCDERCRTELKDGQGAEVEANDDRWSANVLVLGDGVKSVWVTGAVRDVCDIDMFAVRLPAGASLKTRLSDRAGTGCPAAGLKLEVLDAEGGALWTGRAEADGCLALAAGPVPAAAEYFVRITAMGRAAGGAGEAIDFKLWAELP
jgi:cysteine-rich repeat protein